MCRTRSKETKYDEVPLQVSTVDVVQKKGGVFIRGHVRLGWVVVGMGWGRQLHATTCCGTTLI